MRLPEYGALTPEERRQIEAADRQNHKRDRAVEIGNGDLILTDTATGTRYAVRVTSGTLGITAL